MPVALTRRSRYLYSKALREIDAALIDLGEALRYDTDTNKKTLKIAVEELRDAAKRIKSRIKREAA